MVKKRGMATLSKLIYMKTTFNNVHIFFSKIIDLFSSNYLETAYMGHIGTEIRVKSKAIQDTAQCDQTVRTLMDLIISSELRL